MPELAARANVGAAIRDAAAQLASVSDSARLDAELLMAHALGVSRSDVLLRQMADSAPDGFSALVQRRMAHEPLAYITGKQAFFGRDFAVGPGVLIPRADSETTLIATLEAAPQAARVLDCGTGPGTLLLSFLAERPEATGIGIDASAAALGYAARNAETLALGDRAAFHQRDWTHSGWTDGLGPFDLVLANPPYVETGAALDPQVRDWEPAEALFAGAQGLDDYHVLLPQLGALLAPGGVAVIEIGAAQAAAVGAIAQDLGFATSLRHDLGQRPRALVLR